MEYRREFYFFKELSIIELKNYDKMMSESNTPDFSHLTCTNLMIKLKINLKKLSQGANFEFFSNREQFDNIKNHFAKPPYNFKSRKLDDNKYYISILKL